MAPHVRVCQKKRFDAIGELSMCGRYTVIRLNQIVRIIQNVTVKVDLSLELARWNVAPSQDVLIVTQRDVPTLEKARWGLVPSWAKDPAIGNKMINARAETLKEKPAFRAAFKARRCAILADGFYEWRKNDGGGKTPMYIRLRTQEPFAFAGLWESWNGPGGEPLTSCTIITTTPNTLMAPIHNRMPVILQLDQIHSWITQPSRDVDSLLCPMSADAMETYAVSARVNYPENNGPDLIEPVAEPWRLF
jgi:putative SOS response-associated peptidase YedK